MQVHSWEPSLLSLAYEAVHSVAPARDELKVEEEALERGYRIAETITYQHSRSFYLASSFLPRGKRRAARALYAFCRQVDDIVDIPETEDSDPARRRLTERRHQFLSMHPAVDDPVALAWADTRMRYGIPHGYAEQLMDGVARDLKQNRYQNFDELTSYCYGVASTVGLMSMHIIGYSGPEAIPYAVKLGVALQVTNILRDIGEDWAMGRLYLPLDELRAFDLTVEEIEAGRVDARWRSFMRFQIRRNRQLYEEALPGIALLDRNGRFSISAAAELYRAILDEIEEADYDVFDRRAVVSSYRKLRILPGIWWRSRSQSPRQNAEEGV